MSTLYTHASTHYCDQDFFCRNIVWVELLLWKEKIEKHRAGCLNLLLFGGEIRGGGGVLIVTGGSISDNKTFCPCCKSKEVSENGAISQDTLAKCVKKAK